MAKKGSQERCVLTLPLRTQPWQEKILEIRFFIVERLKNSLIAKEQHRLYELQRTKAYRKLMEDISSASKDERKKLWTKRKDMLTKAGFTEFAFKNAITSMQKHFPEHIATHVAHRAASDVWRAFEKHLYHGGKSVHFQKRGTLSSVANQQAGVTMVLDMNTLIFRWSGGRHKNAKALYLPLEPLQTPYEREMLQKEIKYFRVIRRWSKSRYKYYLQITFVGAPVKKPRAVGDSPVGIDIGPQTVAVVGKRNVMLLELADRVVKSHRKIQALQRKMDRSKRSMNPELFNPDGTIKRGVKLRWRFSNHYKKMAGQLKEAQRKNAAIRMYQHTCLVNQIIAIGTDIYVEDMDFRALQRRAKKTTINKNGRYNRKKRFGKSLANKAPSEFLAILSRKLKLYAARDLKKTDKWNYRASQYDHITREYTKKKLGERWRILGNLIYFNWSLFAALCALSLIPAIYQTIKTFLISSSDGGGAFDVIGQMEWFDLINETLQAFLIVPLYSVLNKIFVKDRGAFAQNVFKTGIVAFALYTLFSVGVLIYGSVLVQAMNPGEVNLSVTERYLFLETIAFMIGILVSFVNVIFVVVGKVRNVYIFLGVRTVLSVIADLLLIPSFGVYGVAASNIIVNTILAVASIVLLYGQKYITPCKFGKADLSMFKNWAKVGVFSGTQQFVDNLIYAVMICKMVNMVAEQGNYWNANNFIWGWLLIPIYALTEIIRRDCGEGYKKLRQFNYYFIGICTVLLWGFTIPAWLPFYRNVEGLTNANEIFSITMKLIPFYIAYIGSVIIDNIFVGLGKTIYTMITSLIVNFGYYGIFYILYLNGAITFTMDVIILMFGFGNVVHWIISVVEERFFLRRAENTVSGALEHN